MASNRLAGMISLMTIVACSPSFAQQGTEQQREACTPDAFRLCMSAMPDAGRVEGCLRAAGPRLSPACAAVFEPQQNAEVTRDPRDRRLPREAQQRGRDSGPRDVERREYRRDYQDRDPQSRQPRDQFAPPPQYDDD